MQTKALIMARGGSKRVKNKNTKPFANSSLLEVKISQLKQIKNLDGIVVNSDDEKILSIASSMGCEVIKRADYYCTDNIQPNELYMHLAETFPADIVVITNTTSPLVSNETIYNAIEKFKLVKDEYDSLNTGHLVKDFLWLNGKPLNYDENNKPRSQDLPDIINLNAAINITTRDKMIENRNYVGKHPYIYLIDEVEGIDVDYEIDFEFAEFMYKKLRLNNGD